MPNRILHERICVSETLDKLSADEERFYYRLLVQCDDFGRFDGRSQVILSRCFPLKIEAINSATIQKWLQKLVSVGLVVLYAAEGRPLLYIPTWERYQQRRANTSKYPEPPAPDSIPPTPDSIGNHVIADEITSTRIRYSLSDTRNPVAGNTSDNDDEGADAPAFETEQEVFAYYKQHIWPKARTFKGWTQKKITARLRKFSLQELKDGIDHFSESDWWMEHNSWRGARWFFASDDRSEQFLNLPPQLPTPIRQPNRGVSHA